MTAQAFGEWIALLTSGLSGGTAAIGAVTAAVSAIKSALAAQGIAADTAQLDAVIADAAVRKAREDILLTPPVEG